MNRDFYDSPELKQNKTCLKNCDRKDCFNLFNRNSEATLINPIADIGEYVCSQGYNNLVFIAGESTIILNGLIFENNSKVPSGRKEVRKDWMVTRDTVVQFIMKIAEIDKYIQEKLNQSVEQNFSMFHDFKTSMAIILNCTQDIIDSQPGETFEKKLETSAESIRTLYHALGLITSQMGMMDVITNPKSIKYGFTRPMNIYKLFDKMSKLFTLIAKKRNKTIKITTDGKYYPNSECYESIEFIPLILLDNALKYSIDNSTIHINFKKSAYNKIHIEVSNFGPLVSDHNIPKIFEKYYREKGGIDFSKKGMGIGLWVAQNILEAHNSELSYFKSSPNKLNEGWNNFSFELTTQ